MQARMIWVWKGKSGEKVETQNVDNSFHEFFWDEKRNGEISDEHYVVLFCFFVLFFRWVCQWKIVCVRERERETRRQRERKEERRREVDYARDVCKRKPT